MPRLLLASSSPYRRQLLERLGLSFSCQSPEIDEAPLPGESPSALVQRLAENKAWALANGRPDHLIIGSDQVAALDGHILGKPGTHERAREQLTTANGRRLTFYTGLCLLNTTTQEAQALVETFEVTFRTLTQEQIEGYLHKEKPYDCAGSFKAEGLGIALFERLDGIDPNTLTGLPLIALIRLLKQAGVDPLLTS